MGLRIKLGLDERGLQRVRVLRDEMDPVEITCGHAEFKRACCEAFGLVDPGLDAYEVVELWEGSPVELNPKRSNGASEVLAAASRRLA
jgi:hypothetical protein